MKNKFKITMGALALAVAAVAILACSKVKTAQQEIPCAQQTTEPQDYTLAEMIEAMSWEEGKAFFANQPIKDYTNVCEMVLNDCGSAEKAEGLPYYISWELKMPDNTCNSNYTGSCLMIKKKENSALQANAMGYLEENKLVIVPTTEDNGFTADGYLAIGASIEIEGDSIVIQEGIYMAYYDEETGRYAAVAVDYYRAK